MAANYLWQRQGIGNCSVVEHENYGTNSGAGVPGNKLGGLHGCTTGRLKWMGGSEGLSKLEMKCPCGMLLLLSASRALLACKFSQGRAREIFRSKLDRIC